jgi:hypothetical protein
MMAFARPDAGDEAERPYEASTMNTSYDLLGVPRSASEEAIRSAFHSAAKVCHPDFNGGDPAAEQKLKQLIAAYDDLKSPARRAAYDQFLEDRRRAFVRRCTTSVVAGLAGGGVVLLAVWALGAPQQEQLASTTEWERVGASRDSSKDPNAIAPSRPNAIKVARRKEPRMQEPVVVTTKAVVREEAQNADGVTTKVAIHEELAEQELEGDTKLGHEEPAVRKLTPATAVKRPAKGHDPARPVTAEIRSPAFFGVAF